MRGVPTSAARLGPPVDVGTAPEATAEIAEPDRRLCPPYCPANGAPPFDPTLRHRGDIGRLEGAHRRHRLRPALDLDHVGAAARAFGRFRERPPVNNQTALSARAPGDSGGLPD